MTTDPTTDTRRQHRSQAARDPRLPADQDDAGIRRRQAGTDLARPSSPIRSATASRSCCRTRPGAGLSYSIKIAADRERLMLTKSGVARPGPTCRRAMWAVGELGLEHTRIDVGGAFGKNREPPYLAMNPNGLVPTLEEDDGFLLWESNSIVRYLAGKHEEWRVGAEGCQAARTRQPVDGLAIVGGRARDHAGVLGPDPHAGGKARRGRDQGLAGQDHRRDENPRRATGKDRISSPARRFPTATSRSA